MDDAAETGVIESPNYPNAYAHYLQCFWIVVGPPGRRIKVEFDDFDLEEHRSYNRSGNTFYYCHDRLEVTLNPPLSSYTSFCFDIISQSW